MFKHDDSFSSVEPAADEAEDGIRDDEFEDDSQANVVGGNSSKAVQMEDDGVKDMEPDQLMDFKCPVLMLWSRLIWNLGFEATPSLATRLPPLDISTDQSSLLAFKTYITNFNTNRILVSNWTTTTPSSVCDWVGITCGKHHRRVVALNLPSMGLIGTIPPHLGNLSFLAQLIIANNSFYGDLPKELANLRRLQYIDLGQNNFGGPIPPWLGGIPNEFVNLVNLKILSLQSARLTGLLPHFLFNMSSLQVISVNENNFSGSLPRNICPHGSALVGIYFLRNQLTGGIPFDIGNCTSIQVIELSENNLTEYGREGLLSKRCDVYSFGIMLMEIFTRKKPTDEMFNAGLSLKSWVSESIVNDVIQAIDSNLVRQEEGHVTVKVKCVSSIYELALKCSAESPEERINMKDVLVLLKKIRLEFLANLSCSGT
ncbi:hypothetical protein Vadar_027125 [Vaccinium darrowii]|uniref:Uncharacterized protein n=1 Tax=Vaccinium darrowii TaxID=229202 RepID=A0ACB7XTP9_9ERIC|nr:hypothetical protein Vadar_027125 [Vaccinium darrowii]